MITIFVGCLCLMTMDRISGWAPAAGGCADAYELRCGPVLIISDYDNANVAPGTARLLCPSSTHFTSNTPFFTMDCSARTYGCLVRSIHGTI